MIRLADIEITIIRNQIGFEGIDREGGVSPSDLAHAWQSAAANSIVDLGYNEDTKIEHKNDTAVSIFVSIGGVDFFKTTRNNQTIITGWAGEGIDPFEVALATINEPLIEVGETIETMKDLHFRVETAFLASDNCDDVGREAAENLAREAE